MTPRDKAVQLARQGYRVFRVDSQKHRPARSGWTETASADPERVAQDFTDALGESVDDNPAIATGGDLLVVDVDVKGGKPGLLSLAELAAEGLPLDTRTVRTPSGGLHLYYRVDPSKEYRNRVGWREGVDVRGFNGFVFAPGAVKAAGEYAVERDLPTVDLPDSFYEDLARPPAVRIADNGAIPVAPGVDADSDEVRARVADWLETEAPVSIEGDGGHDTLLDVAHGCMDRGVSPAVAAELMAGHWDFRCDPEWGDDVIAAQVASLVHSRKDRIGCAVAPRAPLGDVFDPIGSEPRGALLSASDCYDLEGTEKDNPLIVDVLDRGAVSILYGPSNVGKSFVGAGCGYAIATESEWAGQETTRGAVLYYAYEGARRFRRRLAALIAHYRPAAPVPLYLAPRPKFAILSPGWRDAVLKDMTEAEQLSGLKVALVIVDTLTAARAGSGTGENDNDAMQAAADVLQKLAQSTGAHFMAIHHTRKGDDEMRGAGALFANIDTAILLKDDVLTVTKQRDLERIKPLALEMVDVTMPADKGGAKSLVAVASKAGPARISEMTGDEEQAYDCAKDVAMTDASGFVCFATGSWEERLAQVVGTAYKRATWRDVLMKLEAKGFIEKLKRGYWRIAKNV